MSATLFWIKSTKQNIQLPLVVMNCLGFGFICMSINDTGGIYSVDFFWLVLVVIISSLLIDLKLGIAQAVSTIIAVVIFYYLNATNVKNYFSGIEEANAEHALFTIPFLMIMLISVLGTYVRMFTKIQHRLEEEKQNKIEQLDSQVTELTKEMDRLRADLAQDFHDEFGNKLAGMSMLSFELKNILEKEKNQRAIQITEKVSANSREIYDAGKDFIWSMKNIRLTPKELFLYLTDFGNDLFNFAQSSFSSRSQLNENQKNSIKNTFDIVLLVKEALTNAYKYAGGKDVRFEIVEHFDEIIISVKDKGRGFNRSTCSKGNGISGMENRAEKIAANLDIQSSSAGTEITLRLQNA